MAASIIDSGVLNMARMWETPARTMGGRWVRWDDAWAADSTLPTRVFNRVTIIRRLDPSSAADLADRIVRFYNVRSDGGEYLVNDPWAALNLEPYGFSKWWSLPFMVRSPAAPSRRGTQLEIREVQSNAAFGDFVHTLVEGFGLPDLADVPTSQVMDDRVLADGAMRCWIGVLGRRPIGTSVAYVSDGVVGVYLVSVLPAMRGRGFGEALTWQAALADRAPSTLQASDLGRPVYERMGYVAALECATWIKTDRKVPG